MKRTTRFLIAVLLVSLLALTAGGVWASQKFQGTVPGIPITGGGDCAGGPVDMGTAIFTPLSPEGNCTISVELVGIDTEEYPFPPEGLAFVSDTFLVTMDPPTALFKVCYAYPPEFAQKKAKIHKLNEAANPQVWGEIPGAEVKDGAVCVTSAKGYITLIGNP